MASESDLHSPEVSASGNLDNDQLAEQVSKISLQNESYNSHISRDSKLSEIRSSSGEHAARDGVRIKLKTDVSLRYECQLTRSKELMSIEFQLLENLTTINISNDGKPMRCFNEVYERKQKLQHAIRTIFDIFQAPVKFKVKNTNEIVTFALIDVVSLDLFNKVNNIIMSFIELIENLVSDDDDDDDEIHGDKNHVDGRIVLKKDTNIHPQITKMSIGDADSDHFVDNKSKNVSNEELAKSVIQNSSRNATKEIKSKLESIITNGSLELHSSQRHSKKDNHHLIRSNDKETFDSSPINKLGKKSLFDSISSQNDEKYDLDEDDGKLEFTEDEPPQEESSVLRLERSPRYNAKRTELSSMLRDQSFLRSPTTPTKSKSIRNNYNNSNYEYVNEEDSSALIASPNEMNAGNKSYHVFPGFSNEYEEEEQTDEYMLQNPLRRIHETDMNNSFNRKGRGERRIKSMIATDGFDVNNYKRTSRQSRNSMKLGNPAIAYDKRMASPNGEFSNANNSYLNYSGSSDRDFPDEDAQIYNRRLFRELSNDGHDIDLYNSTAQGTVTAATNYHNAQYDQHATSSPLHYDNLSSRLMSYRSNNNSYQQLQTSHYQAKSNPSGYGHGGYSEAANNVRRYNYSSASSPTSFQQKPSPTRDHQIPQYRGNSRLLGSPLSRKSILSEQNQYTDSPRAESRRVMSTCAEGIGGTTTRRSLSGKPGADDMIVVNGSKYMLFEQARESSISSSSGPKAWKRHSAMYFDEMNNRNNNAHGNYEYFGNESFVPDNDGYADYDPESNNSPQSLKRLQRHTSRGNNRYSYIV